MFFDAVGIRYRWNLKRLPANCPCGNKFSLDHAVSCIKGGFIHRRHDNLCDTLACLLEEISTEVSTEPILQPLTGKTTQWFQCFRRSSFAHKNKGFLAAIRNYIFLCKGFQPICQIKSKPEALNYVWKKMRRRRKEQQSGTRFFHFLGLQRSWWLYETQHFISTLTEKEQQRETCHQVLLQIMFGRRSLSHWSNRW